MDRFALRIACFCAIAFICPVFLATYVDSHVHNFQWGIRNYWMGYWVVLGAFVPFYFSYKFNKNNTSFLLKISSSARQKSQLTFISLLIPIILVLWLNFRPEFPHISILVNSLFYGFIISAIVYVHNYRFDYLDSMQMDNYAKMERTRTEYQTWLNTTKYLLTAFIIFCLTIYIAFFILPSQYTSIRSEQTLIFNSFVLDLFIGIVFALFAFIEFYNKIQFINVQLSLQKIRIESEYSLVTRRGYVVPLEKGRDGLDKKFDEVLSDSCEP
jgi:hypothetical protein